VRKLIFLFGIILVLLFMIPLVSMANMTTESPPAITNNGNEFTLVIATPDATVLSNVDGIINAGADLITAEIADMTTAQFTSSDIASTANMNTGKIVEGATEVTRNATTAQLNGTLMTSATIVQVTNSNNTFSSVNYDITLTNGSTNGDNLKQVEAVALVLKLPIPTDANVNNNGLAEAVRTLSDNVDLSGSVAATLKMQINFVANTYYTDITDQAETQEGTAYANELAGVVSENTLLTAAWTAGNTGTKTTTTANSPKNTIDTDAMNRPATTLYAEQIATKIAGAGLVAPNFA